MENHPCLCFVLYLTPCTYFVWQPAHSLEADKICELLTPRPWTLQKEMLTKRLLTGSTPSSSLESFRSSPKVSLPAEPSCSSSRSRVPLLSPSSSAELSLESHRSVLSALMSEESPDKLERSLSLSAKTAASAWSASMTKHCDRCQEERWCDFMYASSAKNQMQPAIFFCCHGN